MENLINPSWKLGQPRTANAVTRSIRACLTVLPIIASTYSAHAGNWKVITPADVLHEERQLQASIHAEANASGPAPADEARIAHIMAERKAKEEHDLAVYAQFQFEQRLELAQASAPRIIINNGPGMMGSGEQTGMTEGQEAPVMSSHHGGRYMAMAQQYADKYYVRQVLDQSAQQMSADAAQRVDQATAQTAADNAGLPFGAPVEGKPGMVTGPASPEAGYIDVRGYAPGSKVIDPYSGQMMRVP